MNGDGPEIPSAICLTQSWLTEHSLSKSNGCVLAHLGIPHDPNTAYLNTPTLRQTASELAYRPVQLRHLCRYRAADIIVSLLARALLSMICISTDCRAVVKLIEGIGSLSWWPSAGNEGVVVTAD